MGINLDGSRVPGSKGSGPSALARPWSPAVGRRLGAAGIALVILSVVACTSAGGSGSGASVSPSSAAASSAVPSSAVPSSGAASSLEQQYEQVVAPGAAIGRADLTSEGSGSGVVYDARGDIVTNAHVVGTATALQVGLASGGKPLAASVVGVFAPDDLAVIRVQTGAGSLHPASFGRSASVRVGEIVLAMGNPLGLTGTVTDGIVSATGRTVSEGQGSSRGPHQRHPDQRGDQPRQQRRRPGEPGRPGHRHPDAGRPDPQLGGAAAGIGFAIPSDTVTSIAAQLIATGKVTSSGRASLGISAQTVADASGQPAGIGVVAVTPGGAAAKPESSPATSSRRWPASRLPPSPRCSRCWPRASPVTACRHRYPVTAPSPP